MERLTPKQKRDQRKRLRASKQAMSKVLLSERLVRISPDRGYGNGLWEIVALFGKVDGIAPSEVLLKPYEREGETVQIYRAHTQRARVPEILTYVRAHRA